MSERGRFFNGGSWSHFSERLNEAQQSQSREGDAYFHRAFKSPTYVAKGRQLSASTSRPGSRLVNITKRSFRR